MREILSWAYDRGYELGKEQGLIRGAKNLFLSKNGLFSNEGDSTGLAVIMAFGAAILGLYITSVVMGQVSKSIVGGAKDLFGNGSTDSRAWYSNITADGAQSPGMTTSLNARWNNTLTNFDTASNGSVSLAAILPIAISCVGILGLLMSAFTR